MLLTIALSGAEGYDTAAQLLLSPLLEFKDCAMTP